MREFFNLLPETPPVQTNRVWQRSSDVQIHTRVSGARYASRANMISKVRSFSSSYFYSPVSHAKCVLETSIGALEKTRCIDTPLRGLIRDKLKLIAAGALQFL